MTLDIISRRSDGSYLLRCDCQASFVAMPEEINAANVSNYELRCQGCGGKAPVPTNHTATPRRTLPQKLCRNCGCQQPGQAGRGVFTEPTTERARKCVQLMRDGMPHPEAARKCGMAVSSANSLFMRWIVYPEWLEFKRTANNI